MAKKYLLIFLTLFFFSCNERFYYKKYEYKIFDYGQDKIIYDFTSYSKMRQDSLFFYDNNKVLNGVSYSYFNSDTSISKQFKIDANHSYLLKSYQKEYFINDTLVSIQFDSEVNQTNIVKKVTQKINELEIEKTYFNNVLDEVTISKIANSNKVSEIYCTDFYQETKFCQYDTIIYEGRIKKVKTASFLEVTFDSLKPNILNDSFNQLEKEYHQLKIYNGNKRKVYEISDTLLILREENSKRKKTEAAIKYYGIRVTP